MGTFDIQFALDWLSWRLFAHNRKFSQEYRDKMAAKKLHEAIESPYTADAVKQLAVAAQEEVNRKQQPGAADKSCNSMCKKIIKEADEEDFLNMLANTPQKLVEWRKLWNAVRADKIRRI